MSRNPVTVYGFINAKLRAKIGLMRQDRLSESLLKAASLVEAVGVLRDSRYHDVAQAYDQTGDLQQMELVLLQKEIEMYREVQKYLEGSPSDFVRQLLGKIEVDNLKTASGSGTAVSSGTDRSDIEAGICSRMKCCIRLIGPP
ncbi:hypothetical protein SDC9_41727 [bioreactor metagenome]|uniref:Uncharacterized protein n=1 Tax=bioreactor metagenome TaxID=1076179 RepID=A0A644VVS4_9ZZZZ